MAYTKNKTVVFTVRMSEDAARQLDIIENKLHISSKKCYNYPSWMVKEIDNTSKAFRVMLAIFSKLSQEEIDELYKKYESEIRRAL